MVKLLDGKALADKILHQLKTKISQSPFTPGLAIILVGSDQPSQIYVKLKERAAASIGIRFEKHLFFYNTPEKEILEKIKELNNKPYISGIVVQLPLPRHLDEDNIIKTINWQKDADGFHPFNIKHLLAGQKVIEPSLIKGIFALIKQSKIKLKNKKVAILANSDVFINPLKYLLEKKKAQVSVRKAGDYFQDATQEADIVIVAYGRPELIKANMIKEDAVLIDIGINKTEDGKTLGDIDSENIREKAGFLSPVPGGIGPLTVAYLLENTFLSAEFSHNLKK